MSTARYFRFVQRQYAAKNTKERQAVKINDAWSSLAQAVPRWQRCGSNTSSVFPPTTTAVCSLFHVTERVGSMPQWNIGIGSSSLTALQDRGTSVTTKIYPDPSFVSNQSRHRRCVAVCAQVGAASKGDTSDLKGMA